eukprot:gnl/MRDRNA2_/MRDRNA2_27723_c0_seq2.p1 gnl/MRDRNA2_/MRDRNA2_27723_c0~~gnl/MRDRNA2_/MRDRNA2_27723_c0_seq2.p1  ORF type:complete len:961 (+),score=180.24 gnl/MRDRNA2_/MRDRNA2_27723_c0_seq2:96-2978(+)
MPLLDACLKKHIRLVDYECITKGGIRGKERLVAFGSWAGVAGMINFQRGLGERLLSLGHSTPFLNVGSCYMYRDLECAKRAVLECGEQIAAHGTPEALGPLIFAFLGDGQVSRGAQEIFKLLPHEFVDATDLPRLVQEHASTKKVYGTVCTVEHLVKPKDGTEMHADKKAHYYANPDSYSPVFHEQIAPYCSAIMNNVFWTERFDRILTTKQLRSLHREKNLRLLGVGDISCDLRGSLEFLTQFTTSELPFYLYDVDLDCTHNNLDDHGILMMALDTLPSELPKESSEAFGDALLPFIEPLAISNGELPFDRQTDIPDEMRGAIICNQGKLTPTWDFIAQLRAQNERLARSSQMSSLGGAKLGDSTVRLDEKLLIKGHLFDDGVINKILDVFDEIEQCDVRIEDIQMGATPEEETSAILYIKGEEVSVLHAMQEIHKVVEMLGKKYRNPVVIRKLGEVKTAAKKPPEPAQEVASSSHSESKPVPPSKVLILGSGLVCGPVLEYLHRQPNIEILLASAVISQAEELAAGMERVQATELDIEHEQQRLETMIKEVDLVISLVPARLHVEAARMCISHRKHLVTASYVSSEMQQLNKAAEEAGIAIVNEVGLDPGLDHMSAKLIIDAVHSRGGTIDSFKSLCGGLPAPESAGNALGYKFSWSPRGVLTAGQNSAQYLMHGVECCVPGESLFEAARPVKIAGPALALEHLPNRNSLHYKQSYGLSNATTIYRGTLRYNGFSESMAAIAQLGLLGSCKVDTSSTPTWGSLVASLMPAIPDWEAKGCASIGARGRTAMKRRLIGLYGDAKAARVLETMDHLRFFDDSLETGALQHEDEFLDALCARMQETCAYENGERDMCLLHHEFEALWPPDAENKEGSREKISSTLLMYGEPYPGGPSSMALTVGIPTAVTARLLLDGSITRSGVLIPTIPEIYEPILKEVRNEGIVFVEHADGRMKEVLKHD